MIAEEIKEKIDRRIEKELEREGLTALELYNLARAHAELHRSDYMHDMWEAFKCASWSGGSLHTPGAS